MRAYGSGKAWAWLHSGDGLKALVGWGLVAGLALLCAQIIAASAVNKVAKSDLAELNDVKYGLLSIEEWKFRITGIVVAEIDKIDLAAVDATELRKHVDSLLDTVIDKVAKNIRRQNKGSVEGWMKQAFLDAFVDLEEIKKGIPEYSAAIIREMTSVKSSQQLKAALLGQLSQYSFKTVDLLDQERVMGIVRAAGAHGVPEARANLVAKVTAAEAEIAKTALVMVSLSLLVFALAWTCRRPLAKGPFAMALVCLVLLLVAGVTTPMIDMEAKISQMTFMLIGHPVSFENQVLYFQSKSILDVFLIMITNPDFKMKVVGVLLVSFSVVFPALKLLTSIPYHFDIRGVASQPIVKFFVLKSGKWSMTDVTVVAIFMAYIGFNGVIDSKLGQLATDPSEGPVVLTTNGTSLQPGYYLFFAYALLAMFFSEVLAKKGRTAAPAS